MPKFRYYCPRSTSEPGHSDFVISWLDKQVPLAYCKTCDEHLVVEEYKLVLKAARHARGHPARAKVGSCRR